MGLGMAAGGIEGTEPLGGQGNPFVPQGRRDGVAVVVSRDA